MNIKQSVYDGLDTEQRIEAMVSAIKRNDQTEVERLLQSVPRKMYEQPDAVFTDGVISHLLQDDRIENKPVAYNSLQAQLKRKEVTDSERQSITVRIVDTNGMIYDDKKHKIELAEGITNPELIERYKRWQEYEAAQTLLNN